MAFIILLSLEGCGLQRRLQRIRQNNDAVELNRIDGDDSPESWNDTSGNYKIVNEESAEDTSVEPTLMNAVLDSATGEMVPTEELRAARVVSRRYQVAERNGMVELPFDILVPQELLAARWQVRIVPELTLEGDNLNDTTDLLPVYVTGETYRGKQLKGYQRYENFLSGIVSDTTLFVNRFLLERFIERNIPDLYALKTDSTDVSYEDFISRYDVNAQQAIEHYTRERMKTRNERKMASSGDVFNRLVKVPIDSSKVRLDTVIVNPDGDYIYRYVHTIQTRKGLKYAYIALNSSLYDQARQVYVMPRTDSIEYPISSLSHFVRDITRYKMKTIWRHQEANSTSYIAFAVGKSRIDRNLGDNAAELDMIARRLRDLMQDKEFDLDSIIVNASCSPEGRYAINERLSRERSASVTGYFRDYIRHYQDSVNAERGFSVGEDGHIADSEAKVFDIPMIPTYTPEAWELLDSLVRYDRNLPEEQKSAYFRLASENRRSLDRREYAMQKAPYYRYVKDRFYPQLRAVNFNFNMHRKGMVEEFIQTEEVDTAYMRGVQMLRDRDFKGAVEILQDYDDFNAALALMSVDRNLAAVQCLEDEDNTADVCYLRAILCSRMSQEEEAVSWFRKACEMDRIYKFRGNLDPEISTLIRKYGLDKEEAQL